jgi:hypothetical protein
MNQKSTTNRNFNANESRDLIEIVNYTKELKKLLDKTEFQFHIDSDLQVALEYSSTFLKPRYGSEIPESYKPIHISKYDPLFLVDNKNISVRDNQNIELKQVGEGSFATVSKYKDREYGIDFAVKILKKKSDDREKKRFQKEFEILKSLNSPYILEVYVFDRKRQRYTMEYCDTTLLKLFREKNDKLNFYMRKRIAQQFLYGLSYIHYKKILHRDISLNNILIKKYDLGVIGIKLSDFGLVKDINSDFTNTNTDMKGTIIDHTLSKFKDYSIHNEIYSIGVVLNFIFTGRDNYSLEKKTG